MKRIKAQLLFLLVAYTFCIGQTPEPLIIGEIRTIRSRILKEDRKLDIYLPDNYNTSYEKYPVLYVLDSPDNLLPVIGVIDNLKRYHGFYYDIMRFYRGYSKIRFSVFHRFSLTVSWYFPCTPFWYAETNEFPSMVNCK